MGEGTIIITVRLTPASPEALGGIKKEMEKMMVIALAEEPIGFGLNALVAKLTIPDRGGEQDKLEERLNKLKGVGSFEILSATRAM